MWVTSLASRRSCTGAASPGARISPSSWGKLRQTYTAAASSNSAINAAKAFKVLRIIAFFSS